MLFGYDEANHSIPQPWLQSLCWLSCPWPSPLPSGWDVLRLYRWRCILHVVLYSPPRPFYNAIVKMKSTEQTADGERGHPNLYPCLLIKMARAVRSYNHAAGRGKSAAHARHRRVKRSWAHWEIVTKVCLFREKKSVYLVDLHSIHEDW